MVPPSGRHAPPPPCTFVLNQFATPKFSRSDSTPFHSGTLVDKLGRVTGVVIFVGELQSKRPTFVGRLCSGVIVEQCLQQGYS